MWCSSCCKRPITTSSGPRTGSSTSTRSTRLAGSRRARRSRGMSREKAFNRPCSSWLRARSATCRPREDRKSTRLNSSHSQISYAVFCLKKKKKQNLNMKEVVTKHEHYKRDPHDKDTRRDAAGHG